MGDMCGVQPGRGAGRHRERDQTARVWDARSGALLLELGRRVGEHVARGYFPAKRDAGR